LRSSHHPINTVSFYVRCKTAAIVDREHGRLAPEGMDGYRLDSFLGETIGAIATLR
jgi:hypothetical protein